MERVRDAGSSPAFAETDGFARPPWSLDGAADSTPPVFFLAHARTQCQYPVVGRMVAVEIAVQRLGLCAS